MKYEDKEIIFSIDIPKHTKDIKGYVIEAMQEEGIEIDDVNVLDIEVEKKDNNTNTIHVYSRTNNLTDEAKEYLTKIKSLRELIKAFDVAKTDQEKANIYKVMNDSLKDLEEDLSKTEPQQELEEPIIEIKIEKEEEKDSQEANKEEIKEIKTELEKEAQVYDDLMENFDSLIKEKHKKLDNDKLLKEEEIADIKIEYKEKENDIQKGLIAALRKLKTNKKEKQEEKEETNTQLEDIEAIYTPQNTEVIGEGETPILIPDDKVEEIKENSNGLAQKIVPEKEVEISKEEPLKAPEDMKEMVDSYFKETNEIVDMYSDMEKPVRAESIKEEEKEEKEFEEPPKKSRIDTSKKLVRAYYKKKVKDIEYTAVLDPFMDENVEYNIIQGKTPWDTKLVEDPVKELAASDVEDVLGDVFDNVEEDVDDALNLEEYHESISEDEAQSVIDQELNEVEDHSFDELDDMFPEFAKQAKEEKSRTK